VELHSAAGSHPASSTCNRTRATACSAVSKQGAQHGCMAMRCACVASSCGSHLCMPSNYALMTCFVALFAWYAWTESLLLLLPPGVSQHLVCRCC
jgi:hypothetical protein